VKHYSQLSAVDSGKLYYDAVVEYADLNGDGVDELGRSAALDDRTSSCDYSYCQLY